MNKAELVNALADRLDGNKKAASEALEVVIDTIYRAVAKGEKVTITGFGSFERVQRAARTGRNPQTGETIKVKKSVAPKFRPGQEFKNVVSGTKKLPRLGAGTKKAAGAGATGRKATGTAAAETGRRAGGRSAGAASTGGAGRAGRATGPATGAAKKATRQTGAAKKAGSAGGARKATTKRAAAKR